MSQPGRNRSSAFCDGTLPNQLTIPNNVLPSASRMLETLLTSRIHEHERVVAKRDFVRPDWFPGGISRVDSVGLPQAEIAWCAERK